MKTFGVILKKELLPGHDAPFEQRFPSSPNVEPSHADDPPVHHGHRKLLHLRTDISLTRSFLGAIPHKFSRDNDKYVQTESNIINTLKLQSSNHHLQHRLRQCRCCHHNILRNPPSSGLFGAISSGFQLLFSSRASLESHSYHSLTSW